MEMSISFAAHTDDAQRRRTTWTTTAVAPDGNISCDLILGYPWLRENNLDVQPWRDTLQLHEPPRWILTEHREERRRQGVQGPEEGEEQEEEEEEDLIALVKKMRISEPEVVAKELSKVQATQVCGVVQSEDADDSELAQELRQSILAEFQGRVFCDRV